jgi:hypothetical protein
MNPQLAISNTTARVLAVVCVSGCVHMQESVISLDGARSMISRRWLSSAKRPVIRC